MVPPGRWQTYRQQQQQPNQGSAGSVQPAADPDLLNSDGAADAGLDAADGDDTLDLSLPQDSSPSDNDDPPAAAPSSADPLRAEEEAHVSVLERIVDSKAKARKGVSHEQTIGGTPPPRI
jgi:hypothetical protein